MSLIIFNKYRYGTVIDTIGLYFCFVISLIVDTLREAIERKIIIRYRQKYTFRANCHAWSRSLISSLYHLSFTDLNSFAIHYHRYNSFYTLSQYNYISICCLLTIFCSIFAHILVEQLKCRCCYHSGLSFFAFVRKIMFHF